MRIIETKNPEIADYLENYYVESRFSNKRNIRETVRKHLIEKPNDCLVIIVQEFDKLIGMFISIKEDEDCNLYQAWKEKKFKYTSMIVNKMFNWGRRIGCKYATAGTEDKATRRLYISKYKAVIRNDCILERLL
jgi:hypothetical protein